MPSNETYPLNHPLRVRWAEVDAQGVVFNANYLAFADVAFTEYWREANFDLIRPDLELFVVKAELEYRSPARFDDLLTLRARVDRLGNSSLNATVRIERDGELLCSVILVYVNADPQARASRPLPGALRDAVTAFQAGHVEQ